MKIGILTFSKAPNYGAFLLSFALKRKLEELGGNCYFLNIEKGEKIKDSKLNLLLRYYAFAEVAIKMIVSGKIKNLIKSAEYKKARDKAFSEKFHKILDFDKKNDGEFDLVIIGSDEVFNATGNNEFGFSKQLFGDVKNSKKIISYAASCGPATFKKIKKYDLEDKIFQAMKNFNAISVRDKNTCEIMEKITSAKPHIHIDPVFLFDFKDYLSSNFTKNNYILIYSFQYKITRNEKNEIMKYAKNNDKKIISIGCCYDWCDESILPETPFEVLDYFKNADYVISDTFHGLVFSIKYNKNFCAIVRSNNDKKIGYLLEQFQLKNRKERSGNNISKILDMQIDYLETNKLINKEIEKSMNYLSSFVNEN